MITEQQIIDFTEAHLFYCYLFGGVAIAWITKRYINRKSNDTLCEKTAQSAMCSLITIIAAYCAVEFIPDFHYSLILVIGAVVGCLGLEGIGGIVRKIFLLRTGIDIGADIKDVETQVQKKKDDENKAKRDLSQSQAGGLFDRFKNK